MNGAKHVLVTGGAGYIGSHTCKELARQGFVPVTLDDFSRGNRWAVQFGPCVEADVGDRSQVAQTLRAYNIRDVVHFAAFAYVGESVENPEPYFHRNVVATLALLDAMRDAGADRLVFSSSCATYGTPESVPITESAPQRPLSPYGETKLFCEKMAEAYGRAYNLRWTALRYFNAAGCDPEGEVGETHDPETHLIPNVLRAALGRIPALHLYGTDYPTPDGTAIRDYIHVSDLATAHVAALRYLADGGASGAFNLGSGTGFSIRQVIAEAERVTQRAVPIVECPRREGDPPALWGDPSKAEATLGWKAVHSQLPEILETAYRWLSDPRSVREAQ